MEHRMRTMLVLSVNFNRIVACFGINKFARFSYIMWRYAFSYASFLLAPVVADVCDVCPVLRSDSVDIVCKYGGETIQCDSAILPGTTATLACKFGYKMPLDEDQGYREITCSSGGTWDRSLFKCIPDCGESIPQGTPMIVNGTTVEYGTFPWHVGIYKINSEGNYDQLCGGTLVKPDLVISAAHCFFIEDHGNGRTENASLFKVAAGKYYRLYHWPEKYRQVSFVEEIHLPDRYYGFKRNYELDIALLRLDTPFDLTTLVRPVCIDWDKKYERDHLYNGSIGKVVGWGLDASGDPSLRLQELNLPYIEYPECMAKVPQDFKSIIVDDKFCAGYLNGSSVCPGDSGGGLCFHYNGRWILRGIVSIGPVSQNVDLKCESNFYTAFTNVGVHLGWIRSVYSSPRALVAYPTPPAPPGCVTGPTSTCVIPKRPAGGSFRMGSCRKNCSVKAGRRVPLGTFLNYKCKKGFTLKGITPSFCHESGWYRPPVCFKACPALRSMNVDIVCKNGNETVSCANPMLPGTRASMGCRNLYKTSNDYSEIICLEDGVWDHPILQCVPDCGVALDRDSPLIVNGLAVKHGSLPWHIRIYRRSAQLSGKYILGNSGSLISPNLVLTSVVGMRYNGSLVNVSELLVVASKYYPSYYDTEFFSQESLVKGITVSGRPNFSTSSDDNLVLVHLATPFIMTTLARPVCIDWNGTLVDQHLRRGKIGRISNDFNELEGLPMKMRTEEVDFAFIPREECLSAIEEQSKPDVGLHMFCANNVNRSQDAIGDQGAGLYFESDGLWYLRGVMVYLVVNDETAFIGYTFINVGDFLGWIRDVSNAEV